MNPLSSIGVLQDLPEGALARLARGALTLEPRHGAEIFVQGAPADAVYVVTGGDGCVRIGAADRRAKKLMVELIRAGEVFGEVAVLDGGCRTATATADGRVKLLRIGAGVFLEVLGDTPGLGRNLARALARRLRRTFDLFQDATFDSLEKRLARQLVYLAAVQGRAGPHGVVIAAQLKQPDLADLLGATSRSIITILNAWRAGGLVKFDAVFARLTILDMPRMRRLVAEED